ncbi:DUF4189 domain-containing protein [Burkholderia sp. Bp9012]|uniref:DUF4189 domain-containing protein n=1 Tax=Burkholderia sp. Bp9012 TaxID=2184562 RepID=UPI000F5A1780|nr:DUF4189 domain-containing protein [Burkholderia sp. Bp9012]RQR79216.1 DUF4189 domain-containing protein [Burkholderia sp. Bp9012]
MLSLKRIVLAVGSPAAYRMRLHMPARAMVRLAVLATALLVGRAVCAQVSCPAGQMSYGGTDISSCGPIPPGYQGNMAPPPPRWMHQWGAIATHDDDGSFGASVDMPSESRAVEAARENCRSKHGSTCTVQITYHDQCVSMVISAKRYNVGSAPTVEEATQSGMETCVNSGDPHCRVYYTACSMPRRIQ